MSDLVLFDLDGTLTPPRSSMEWTMVPILRELSRYASIGIVSGSPLDYIEQQASIAWSSIGALFPEDLLIMPCNGTQLFMWDKEKKEFVCEYKLDFRTHLIEKHGSAAYSELVKHILVSQLHFMKSYKFNNLTGNFLSFRSSMVNWSLPGRDAGPLERAKFEELDKKHAVRQRSRSVLQESLDTGDLSDIELTLGGVTSIDIYPNGWDKTHALTHCGNHRVWFVGDKCHPGGNDRSLWQKLEPMGRGFMTTGPTETKQIIRNMILPSIHGTQN
jgi:phosphomannomutase